MHYTSIFTEVHGMVGASAPVHTDEESTDRLHSRIRDLNTFFKMGPGGFSRNPETFAFIQLQKYLSNIEWVYVYVLYMHQRHTGST